MTDVECFCETFNPSMAPLSFSNSSKSNKKFKTNNGEGERRRGQLFHSENRLFIFTKNLQVCVFCILNQLSAISFVNRIRFVRFSTRPSPFGRRQKLSSASLNVVQLEKFLFFILTLYLFLISKQVHRR